MNTSPCPPLVVQAGKRAWTYRRKGKLFRLSPTQRERLFGDRCYEPALLGCGTFACVYTHADPDKVAKFTADPADALASKRIMELYGEHVPENLLRVYGVHHLVGLLGPARRRSITEPHWAIVLDRAEAPSKEDRQVQRRWLHCPGRHAWGYHSERFTRDGVDAQCGPGVYDYHSAILQARDDLKSVDVGWSDDHRGNLMRRNGRWVVVDYGYSDVNPAVAGRPADLFGPRPARWRGWR